MKFVIDNTDYTSALDAERPPRIVRTLNRPSTFECGVILAPSGPVVPAAGARVVLERSDGTKLFTGYLDAIPEHEYLGWGERGPEYRLRLAATSDEALLDRKRVPDQPTLLGRTAGDALKRLTEQLLPGAFDETQVSALDVLPGYAPDVQQSWSEHAAEIALRARAAYRVHDGALVFRALGAATHAVHEPAEQFDPDGLKLASPSMLANDVIVIGRVEPQQHVRDYFLGDGLTLRFDLSRTPFTTFTSTLIDEEFENATLDPILWTETDPANAVSVSGGKLTAAGGTGIDGQTTVVAVEKLEIAGGLLLQHGEVSFSSGASNAVLGGIYNGAVAIASCVAGFRVTPSGGQSVIQALINGAVTGATVTTVANHRYGLTTRLYADQGYRQQQVFHSSAHPAGSPRGGAAIASDVRVVLELHDIDPANPGSQGFAATVLYDGVLANAPALCAYAPLNVASAFCSLPFVRMARISDVQVRSQLPSQGYRTRLVGSLADGGECVVVSEPALQFFSQYPPSLGERVVARYRSSSRALARVTDPASIAAHASGADDGVRARIHNIAAPGPRSAADCENAALALLDDSTQPAWTGQYEVWNDFLPGGAASDVWPGDAITLDVPSRAADFSAIVRGVEIECLDLLGDGSRYRIVFANEAAQPLAFAFDPARIGGELEITSTTTTAGTTFAPDLPAAEITDATSTTVAIDCGITPLAGGGIEVRRADRNWGPADDRDLVSRYTTRAFVVPRLTRVVDFFLRQYDSAGRYSRYATLLHLDWPYV